jgi:hypothetical protein
LMPSMRELSRLRLHVFSGLRHDEKSLRRLGALARDRTKPLRTVVNAVERDIITERAKASGLTVSAFLRAAAIGAPCPTIPDRKAIDVLAKINADQGRLGGLLKMYLQDRNPDRLVAERILADIEVVRVELKAAVNGLRT